MPAFLEKRRREAEWMDEPGADAGELRKSLAFIRRVNRTFGYTQAVLDHLGRFSRRWTADRPIRIVDVGTGSADIPLAILQWGASCGFDLQVVGVDLNPTIAKLAAEDANNSRLKIIQGDALNLPFGDDSFDYAITSMFLHHLDDDQARRAMAELGRVARRGVIVSDLLRKKHAYAFIWLFTLFSNPMVKHDARVSIAQAFNETEILALRNEAGIGFAKYFIHMRHRFVLAGEKPGAS